MINKLSYRKVNNVRYSFYTLCIIYYLHLERELLPLLVRYDVRTSIVTMVRYDIRTDYCTVLSKLQCKVFNVCSCTEGWV
jgi:hypothetical protein